MTKQEYEQLLSMSRQGQANQSLRLSTHELLCKVFLELDAEQREIKDLIDSNHSLNSRSITQLWQCLVTFQIVVAIVIGLLSGSFLAR